jgi:hypothetical protein
MKTRLRRIADISERTLPAGCEHCVEAWVGGMTSGRYSIAIRFYVSESATLDALLAMADPIVRDFEKRFDAMIYEEAPELSGGHNRIARGSLKFRSADDIIPHLAPDAVYFSNTSFFCIEFSPYRPLAHLGASLRLYPTRDWFLQTTSWDRDLPRFRRLRKNA